MWNKEGKNILVALGDISKVHEAELSSASIMLGTSIPSGAEIQQLVVKLCGARERMQRCWLLRDQLNLARMDKKSLEDVTRTFLNELAAEETRRRNMLEEDAGEDIGADYIERVSLDALRDLHRTLSGFSNTPPAELKLEHSHDAAE